MRRTVIIGDLHGCKAELDALLDKVGFGMEDRLYCVGDLVARGPDGVGALRLLKRLGAHSVLGNHDAKLRALRPKPGQRAPDKIPSSVANVFDKLEEQDWQMFDELPLYLDLPEHDLRVVHAGVVPNLPIDQQDPWVLTNLRSFDAEGKPSSQWSPTTWAVRYHELPHVVFGHDARSRLQLHPRASGIDTGCVYGGELTALVLPAEARLPPPGERRDLLVSVAARQAYANLGLGA